MSFIDAAACGDLQSITEQLSRPSTPKEQVNSVDKDGRSALHYACLNDDTVLLRLLLSDERVDVNQTSPKGDTCLHMAALYSSLQVLKLLFGEPRTLKVINAQNNFGETPLHLCSGSGDKGAGKTAEMLLQAGASMLILDQWKRSAFDVAKDNGENSCVQVLEAWIQKLDAGVQKQITDNSKAYQESKLVMNNGVSVEVKKEQAKMIFGALNGPILKGLKKVNVVEKTMFAKSEGNVVQNSGATPPTLMMKNGGKVLSKMVDFPGNKDEIQTHLNDPLVDAGGKDAYGLTALMKFASWNKVEFIEMVIPKLSRDQINAQDPDGKTALHWACEMASVAAVAHLSQCKDVDKQIKDAKGRTPRGILDTGSGNIIQRLKEALGQ